MAVQIVSQIAKQTMKEKFDDNWTLTEIGDYYGVSRKTVRRCIDEVISASKTTEVKVTPSKYLPVGSRVVIREDSEYYGLGSANPNNDIAGYLKSCYPEIEFCYEVEFDNGYSNRYTVDDLELVEDKQVREDENADYFVTAPQDSITIIRIDRDTGEVTERQTNKHNTAFQNLRGRLKVDQSQETLRKIYEEMDTKFALKAYSVGRVQVNPEAETVVFVKAGGTERTVPDDIAHDIIATVREYGPKEGEKLVKFLDKLMENPSFKAIEGLYRFMKHNCISINDDGSIEAWKGVETDLYSKRAGAIKNSPTCPVGKDGRIYNGNFGTEIRVDRSEVNDDPDETCAKGLHVGNKSYASSWAPRLLKVRVEPQDVVAVPKDYNGAKMRCSAYVPVGIVE